MSNPTGAGGRKPSKPSKKSLHTSFSFLKSRKRRRSSSYPQNILTITYPPQRLSWSEGIQLGLTDTGTDLGKELGGGNGE